MIQFHDSHLFQIVNKEMLSPSLSLARELDKHCREDNETEAVVSSPEAHIAVEETGQMEWNNS